MTCINPRQYKIYNVILPKPSPFKFGSTTILTDIGGPSSTLSTSSTSSASSSSSSLGSSSSTAAAATSATSSAGSSSSSSSGFYINSYDSNIQPYSSTSTTATSTASSLNYNHNTILNIPDKSINPINGIHQNRVNFVYPPSLENSTKLFTNTIPQEQSSSSSSSSTSTSTSASSSSSSSSTASTSSSTASTSTSTSSALLQKLQQQKQREKQLQSTEKRIFRYKTTSNDSISCEIKIFKPIHTPAIRKVPKVVLRVPTKKVYPSLPPDGNVIPIPPPPPPPPSYKCKPQKNKKCTFRPNLRGKNRYSAFCVVPSAITTTAKVKNQSNSNKKIITITNNGIDNVNGINEENHLMMSSQNSTDLLNNVIIMNKKKKLSSSSKSSNTTSNTIQGTSQDLQSIEQQNSISKNGYFLRSKRKLNNNLTTATINDRRLSSDMIKSAIETNKNVNKRHKNRNRKINNDDDDNDGDDDDNDDDYDVDVTKSSKRVSSKKVKKN